MCDYIRWIRSKVGHDPIILNFAGVCLTNDQGEILLQKRSQTEDLWGLPGGAMEIGESIAETAIREIQEETGLIVQIDYLIGVYSKYFTQYPNGDQAQSICYLFKASPIGGELHIDQKETFDLQFFSKENLPPLFVRQHTDAIEDFFAGQKGIFR